MIAWFARNHVAANLLMATIVFLGLLSLSQRIPLEVFPEIELDIVNVSVSIRGATPSEVEQSVTVRIEEALQSINGIKQITSQSSESSARITAEVDSGYDPKDVLTEIKNKVDAIGTLPVDAERPIIGIAETLREVISLGIAGEYSEADMRTYAEQVRDDLLRLPGITHVELDGVRALEITIEVSEQALIRYGITLDKVANAIARSSSDISAGSLRTQGGDILIRSQGQAYRTDEFANIIVLRNTDGSMVTVSDVARVIDGFEESDLSTRFNGKNAAMIEVYRTGDQNAITIAQQVIDYIAEKQGSLPPGVELITWRDRSTIVKKRLNTLVNNAIQGGLLVILLLALFLRPSVAFWVCLGIPVSFMGAFIFMPFAGVTLNIFSLFAFILVLGIVVDDAIVTGESVYAHMRKGESGLAAAIDGTHAISTPVTFGVLTTIAAFIPLMFIEGARGDLFAQIPLVVIPIFIFSLIESKLVLPAHLKHIKVHRDTKKDGGFTRWQQNFADGFERFVERFYQPILEACLRHRYLVLAIFIGSLVIILALITSGWTRFVFFPRVPSEVARAELVMPAGTPFEVTDRYVQKMTNAAIQLKQKYRDTESGQELIPNVLATTGSSGGRSSGGNVGRVMFEITAPEERVLQIGSAELVQEWRKLIGPIPGAESINFRAEIGRSSDPIDIQLQGNDYVELAEVAERIKQQLGTYPTVFDISDSFSDGKQELLIELKPEAYALGLSRNDVALQVRSAFFGQQVQRIQRGRDDIRVMVRFPRSDREASVDLQDRYITLPTGGSVPLSQVATLVPGKSPSTITRIDRYRTINVRADIDKENTNMLVLQGDLSDFIDDLLVQYPSVRYSLEGEAKEQRESFGSLQWGLLLVLFLIYTLLAIPLKSYFKPLIVMSVIPFGIVGAVIGHWIMGMDLTLMSLLGIMALVGVIVNDSLVLVDFINKRGERAEFSTQEAILSAGVVRFRPIMLTSVTTFIGLMPLLFEKSTQAQFLIPMAVSLGFGILFATLLTLIFVPINYLVMDDVKQLWRRES